VCGVERPVEGLPTKKVNLQCKKHRVFAILQLLWHVILKYGAVPKLTYAFEGSRKCLDKGVKIQPLKLGARL